MTTSDALWDQPLDEVPLVFLDLEMTGCDPSASRICEVALHRVEHGEVTGRLVSLVAPGVPVGDSERVHGIGDADLEGAPTLAELKDEVAAVFEGAVAVGHAVAFDLAFLAAAEARGELRDVPRQAIDTRGLAQRALRTGSAALAALAADLGLPAPSHRAEPDVLATRALFDVLRTTLRPRTARDLLLAQDVGGHATLRDDVKAVLEQAEAARRAVRVCYRIPGRRPTEDLFDVWALEPPRVEGWLHDKGARRVLRGDRLLWVELTGEPFARAAPRGFRPTIAAVASDDTVLPDDDAGRDHEPRTSTS